jgi:hypothetical protein
MKLTTNKKSIKGRNLEIRDWNTHTAKDFDGVAHTTLTMYYRDGETNRAAELVFTQPNELKYLAQLLTDAAQYLAELKENKKDREKNIK